MDLTCSASSADKDALELNWPLQETLELLSERLGLPPPQPFSKDTVLPWVDPEVKTQQRPRPRSIFTENFQPSMRAALSASLIRND